MPSLIKSGAIRTTERQFNALNVWTLTDGTEKCYAHREVIKKDGYQFNHTRKQWGKFVCVAGGKPTVLELLQAGVLDASEQPDGVVAIANGFGSTYNFQHLLKAAHFRFNNESKTYRKEASSAAESARRPRACSEPMAEMEGSRCTAAGRARHGRRAQPEDRASCSARATGRCLTRRWPACVRG